MTAIELTIPRPAPIWSTNERLHHHAQARLTKAWRATTAMIATSWRNTHRADWNRCQNRPCTVSVTLGFDTARRRDSHNYTSTVVKAIVDGLVDTGLWPDDTAEWVTVNDPVLVVGAANVVVRIEVRP